MTGRDAQGVPLLPGDAVVAHRRRVVMSDSVPRGLDRCRSSEGVEELLHLSQAPLDQKTLRRRIPSSGLGDLVCGCWAAQVEHSADLGVPLEELGHLLADRVWKSVRKGMSSGREEQVAAMGVDDRSRWLLVLATCSTSALPRGAPRHDVVMPPRYLVALWMTRSIPIPGALIEGCEVESMTINPCTTSGWLHPLHVDDVQ